jgi:hypothetical protein
MMGSAGPPDAAAGVPEGLAGYLLIGDFACLVRESAFARWLRAKMWTLSAREFACGGDWDPEIALLTGVIREEYSIVLSKGETHLSCYICTKMPKSTSIIGGCSSRAVLP